MVRTTFWAVREKVRFQYKGSVSTEDLWDLSLQELDGIFKSLNVKQRESKEDSLLAEKTKPDKILELKLEIVRHIINVKLDEEKARKEERQKAERKQKLLGIIAEKQDAELKDLSLDEIKKMVDEL